MIYIRSNEERILRRLHIANQVNQAKVDVDSILSENAFYEAIEMVRGGLQGSKWLRDAYVSYYRGVTTVSLCSVSRLDGINIEIFRLMCSLRNIKGWKDQSLFELEMYAKQIS